LTCQHCSWHRKYELLEIDFQNLEIDLRGKRREIASLKAELSKQYAQAVEAPLIQALFDYWRLSCRAGRKTVKLGEKRRKVIQARLREGYTAGQLRRAIDGAVVGAFEKDGKRYDDLELICRDEVKLDSFIARFDAYERRGLQRMRDGLPFKEDWEEPVDATPAAAERAMEIVKLREYLDTAGERR
jgi:hypothetical protein